MEQQTQAGNIPASVQEIPGRGQTFQAARERMNQTLAGVGERAQNAYREACEYTDQTVRNNHWTSVGVGFGIGVVVGALVALAASSRR